MNVQGYIALLQQGRFKESVELIRRSMPFPAICGRVCFSPCQDACSRKNVDQPVGIRFLKRLAADIEREQGRVKPDPVPKTHTERVAIVGGGPAGLTAAWELAKLGYLVTVFERMAELGGMMRYGIPDYRLQKYVVANEISYIKDLGVEIRTGIDFGKDMQLETLRNEGFKAIFIAIGAQLSRKLGIPGEDLEGVYHAVEFLRCISLGRAVRVGKKVAVIGGGNSAVDAARTSLRLGAKEVLILYRRSRNEMPALPHEIEAAEEEGVQLHFLVSPKKIIADKGSIKLVECLKMKLGEPDASGRRKPIPIQGSEHTHVVDTVIVAIGQLTETSYLPSILLDERSGTISVDPLTLETRIPGVFAGGDIATGPASVIEAIGAGQRAAVSIDCYLKGRDLRAGREEEIEEVTWVENWEMITNKPQRYRTPLVDVGRRKVSFSEADELLAKTKQVAILEARRCLGCGPCSECLVSEGLCEADRAMVDETLCTGCNVCALVCPYGAMKKNELGVAEVDQDLCKGCGTCCASCPEGAIRMQQPTQVRHDRYPNGFGERTREMVNPNIICFICRWSLPTQLNTVSSNKIRSHPKVNFVRVMCIGGIDPVVILDTFAKGVDGVLVIGCHPPDCHFIEGNLQAERKIEMLKKLVSLTGLEPERLRLEWFRKSEIEGFAKIVEDFRKQMMALGQSPLAREKPDSNMLLNIEAAKAAAEGFAIRVLVGTKRELTGRGNVYGERISCDEFNSLLHETIETEYVRHKIYLLTKERPLSVKEIAAITDLKPMSVLRHIVELRKKRMVTIDHVDRTTPIYKVLEVQ